MTKRNTQNVREIRTISVTDLRSVVEEGKSFLEGYAALYNVRSRDLGWGFGKIYEILAPGAFTRALTEHQDVRHLFNHDPSVVLGRTKSGTTILSEDDKGLKFRTLLPDTQAARDLVASVTRGDINECSFGFICCKATWSEEVENRETVDIRTVEDLDLLDVSTVTYPAYPQTDTHLAMRTMFPDGVPAEIRARAQRDAQDGDPEICDCACPDCRCGNCEMCSNMYCREDGCLHGYPPNHERSVRPVETRKEKTKRKGGEDLPASAFLLVGDPDNPDTWSLPVHFSTEEKTKSHIKDALARFNQVEGFSEEQKKEAWAKLEKLAEEHGIQVSDADKQKHRSADPAAQAAIEAKLTVDWAYAKLRALRASL